MLNDDISVKQPPCNISEDPPMYIEHSRLCNQLHKIYIAKNIAYGNSFSKTFDDYGIISALVRMSDKWNRINSLASGAKNDVNDESIIDTLLDLANYAIMTVMELEAQSGRIVL